jgi:dienelactone hydrolase
MSYPKAFDPLTQLDLLARQTPRQFAFTARTASDARVWQRRARAALRDALGFLDQKRVPLRPRVEQTVDRGEYVRRRVILRTSAASEMPVYVLTPKSASRRNRAPCVLALHGHGYGVRDIVGVWEDGTERYTPNGYHKDFATELAKRGFVVIAPEISCFGDRRTDYSHLGPGRTPTTCFNAGTYAQMLGGSIAGIRVFDAMRAVDYLETLAEADAARLAVMGISGGGMHAFFSACLDTRIKAAVISGYFCDWRHSILAIHHCLCNFVPGALKLGELSDLAGLIAPRPLLVENGTKDDIFPIDDVKRTVERARRAWRAFGAESKLETDYFEGTHQIGGGRAYDFLTEHLTAHSYHGFPTRADDVRRRTPQAQVKNP